MAVTAEKIFDAQIPVICGGIPVFPGDIILADNEGIVVMGEEEMTKILVAAESI